MVSLLLLCITAGSLYGIGRRWTTVNEGPEAATIRDIAREILRYLERYPEATDTIDGIVQWWLRREGSERVLWDVERAVSWLCAQGFLLETRRSGVPPYYRGNAQQREAIAKLLKDL
jgi:hypothetical protein